ncbi:tyrosine-type recombinase/integrase [Saccharospirillum sp.]|uniref:tyrosine-type recombinase/integrase n=1 Tax=Saccharospirillum sp. TaxID=2033801 RepID=UPI0034A06075
MSAKIRLNKTGLAKLEPTPGTQVIYWDDSLTGFGVRVSPGGTQTFFYQGRLGGKVKKITIGRNGPITPEAARKEAKRIQSMLELGKDPSPAKEDTTGATFGALLMAYVQLLESQGKYSARAVANAFAKDVQTPFPKLWNKQANQINLDDCVQIIGAIKEAGKPRQADKLRSYIRTAFSEAINARGDVNAPASMRAMKVATNPARDMRKVKGSSQARDRALSLAEFRAYWRRIQLLDEPRRSLAMLHVITGGQRQQQLARVTLADIDRDAMTMTIMDSKGRRALPRRHTVPLLPQALELIDGITGGGAYVFSSNGGSTPIDIDYLNRITRRVCAEMAEAGELEGERFTAGTIRATIETRLMKKPYRVSSDVLARLLSHGLGGIQAKHYAHDSMHDEQQEALEMLQRMVEGKPEPSAQVIPFNREASA